MMTLKILTEQLIFREGKIIAAVRARNPRDNPYDYDMGYPQILQNDEGKLVALYYIAREERPHSYIEAAIFKP